MEPTLAPGDRVLVLRLRVRPGDVVALRDPRDEARTILKRVTAVDGDELTVLGDNAAASTDSRTFGPVPRSSVLGRVVYRYAPTARAGRLRQ
jgi:nickel-type superoxide dismutase maturation protease